MKKYQIKSLCNISRTIAVMIVGVVCSHSMAQIIDDEAVKRAKELVEQMTLREKIDYLSGETPFHCVLFHVWEFLAYCWLMVLVAFAIMHLIAPCSHRAS